MLRALLVLCVVLLGTAAALAFGTDPARNGLGSEHERITRAAITELGPLTLDRLTGNATSRGAVGAPDRHDIENEWNATSHCDDGDYLTPEVAHVPKYGHTQDEAKTALTACRDLIVAEIEKAIESAKGLSTPTAEDTALDCTFDGTGSSAKCDVIEHLGLAFHAAQDFYAHSNWVDQSAPGALTSDNPPGLSKVGRAPWLDPRKHEPFPDGLISGCPGDVAVGGVIVGCEYGDWSPVSGLRRVTTADLSKDFGPIGRGQGGVGQTPRGKINGNFARAVAAAVDDTRDKWAYFKERVLAVYGDRASGAILCALENDDLNLESCEKKIAESNACTARVAAITGGDAMTVDLTADEERDAETMYPVLRSYCVLEESDVTRNIVERGGTAELGREQAKVSAVRALALWNACPAQLQERQATTVQDYDKAFADKDKKSKAAQKQVADRLGGLFADCILEARARQLRR